MAYLISADGVTTPPRVGVKYLDGSSDAMFAVRCASSLVDSAVARNCASVAFPTHPAFAVSAVELGRVCAPEHQKRSAAAVCARRCGRLVLTVDIREWSITISTVIRSARPADTEI